MQWKMPQSLSFSIRFLHSIFGSFTFQNQHLTRCKRKKTTQTGTAVREMAYGVGWQFSFPFMGDEIWDFGNFFWEFLFFKYFWKLIEWFFAIIMILPRFNSKLMTYSIKVYREQIWMGDLKNSQVCHGFWFLT